MKNSTHYTEDDLILFFYGEAPDPVGIRQALAADPELRSRFDDLERVLTSVELPAPERPESYGAQVWARLRPELERPVRRSLFSLLGGPWVVSPAWASAGAAAVLFLLVGFFAGRFWPSPESTVARGLSEPVRDRILSGEVAGHLESSERLLVEVANGDPEGDSDLSSERAWARELLESNRLYRQSARHGGRQRLASLLDELEPFLLELAHASDEMSPEEMAELRDRIEEQALLFKVRILGERLERSVRQSSAGENKQTL
ncbi:MAG TPA: hypothetical protein VE078_13555 [Thermoanaerobaculia bacterium]|nr:hypothetical protein [Thermoanaerobaculia bacterium]